MALLVPRIEAIAVRLRQARHDASVEDRLLETPPCLRLTVRPWRGPWAEHPVAREGWFEVSSDPEDSEALVARYCLDTQGDVPTHEVRTDLSKQPVPWVEGHVVDFVRRVLTNL